ncbi:MAG: hypothetical protein GY714_19845 [Desulfobacterales bacterium]|nr:hypothetical protein [Desulfobacterales bacterium]
MSYNYIVTTKGLDLIAMVQADPTKKIEFVRAEIGNGAPEDVLNPEIYNSLIGSIKKDAAIQNKELLSDESVKITVSYDNEFVDTGFYVHEVGLYVKDPVDESKEILFLYCNSSEADFLPDNTSAVNVEQVVNLIIKMSNTENVTITATSSSNVIRENFGENTILKADVAGEPVSLKVEPNTIIGRKGNESDKIEDLTPSEARDILNVPELVEGKISNEHNNVSNSPRQAILALNDISYKTSNVKIADEHSYTGNGVVRELDFGMDFVTQNSVNQFGGIAFGKGIGIGHNTRFKDSDMLDDQFLLMDDAIALYTRDTDTRKFTDKGIEIGSDTGLNTSNEESKFFAFQTTKKEQKKIYEGVKSVVFKCHNNWGSDLRTGFRSLEFYNGVERYNYTTSDFAVYASSELSINYSAYKAFDTLLPLTGSHGNNQWLTNDNMIIEQTLIIVFNSPIDITHVDVNNAHNFGTSHTNYGVKDLDVVFTDQTLDTSHTVWDTSIPNGETVWSGRLSPHGPADSATPQTIMYTPWRYNPNNGFAFHTRTGRGVAEQIKNPPEMDGMKLCFKFTKDINANRHWAVCSDKMLATQGLWLNTADVPISNIGFNNNEGPTSECYSIGNYENLADRDHTIKDYCFFGKDLSYIEPGLTGVEGATAFMKADPSQTFDCGFEPQVIIIKALDGAYDWRIYTKDNEFQDVVMSTSITKAKLTDALDYRPFINGSKITSPSTTQHEKYLIMAFAEVVSVPADNKVINTTAKSSPGTSSEREVDMGMDFISNENGGMVLTKGGNNDWAVFDTIRGPLKRLKTNADSLEYTDTDSLKDFTKNGIKVGSLVDVNGESDQFYMGFQTDEKVTPPKWKAKSVVFDIANNHGATDYIRLRSIEFYKEDVLLPYTESDFTCHSTADNSNFKANNIFITGKSKIGSDTNNGWRSNATEVTNQRIVVNFNSEIEFDKVVINNGHESGTNTTSGAQLIDIQITNFDYTNSNYGAVVTGSVNRILKSNILKHPDIDDIDDKVYVDISDEWQINRSSGFGMCKTTGTGANRVFRTPLGKEPCMLWVKNINSTDSWIVYFQENSVDKGYYLNTIGVEIDTDAFEAYFSTSKPFTKNEFYLNVPNQNEYMIYAWFGDYFKDSATGEVIANDSKRVMGVKGTSAFFKGTSVTTGTQTYNTQIDDIETIIWKHRVNTGGGWQIISRGLNNFQDRYELNSTNKFGPSAEPTISINGSEITVTASSADLDHYIFMVFGREADKDTKEYVPWMNQVNHIGTGAADTSIDLGLDFSTGDNGGMVLQKSLDDPTSWIIADTLRGVEKGLHTDAINAEFTSSELLKEFTETGIKVGADVHLNKLNSEIATFGFNTTHKTNPTRRKVKSAIFKFEDWGNGGMGIRRIEFYKDTLINLVDSDFDAYTSNSTPTREAKNAFLTSGSKTGGADDTSWYTSQNATNQVLIIVFKEEQEIDYIRVNNFHNTGADTNLGVKNTKVYFTEEDLTEDKYSSFSYTDEVTNSELVYDGVFDLHHASDVECYTQYLYTPWHYNPQTGFGFFTYNGNGTEVTIPNVLGKQPTMIWWKNLESSSWVTYSKVMGNGKYGHLDSNAPINGNSVIFNDIKKDFIELKSGTNSYDHIAYVWAGDDMSILGNPQEAFGIVGTSLFTERKVADTEIELGFVPEVILVKGISTAGHWYLFVSSSNDNVFDSYTSLDTTNVLTTHPEGSTSNMWVEGTRLKFGTAYTEDHLICAFAKNTYKPQGKSIVIHGSESNPSLFSIADGFNKYQAVDKLIGYDRNVVFSFNEGDGTYYIKLNIDGTISLKNENCFYGKTNPNTGQDFFDIKKYKMFSPSGSVTPGIYIGKIVIQNDAILDVTTYQDGVEAEVEWFPVSVNSMYIKENPYFTTYVDWDIWWNSVDSDENMRHVTGQYYVSSSALGMGAYKRQNSNEIIVGSAKNHTFYSGTSGDPADGNSTAGGYYKLMIRRKF